MKQRIIFIHGNQASEGWDFGWAAWLKSELNLRGYETVFETMPDSIICRQEYWLPFMQNQLKIGEQDVIVGWSTGAVAAMCYAQNHRIKGSVLVSPSHTDLDDDLEKQSGYFDEPWDWEAIKANQSKIGLFYGTDDPYIPQEQFNYISEHLKPQVHAIAGGEHFIERIEFPELIQYIAGTFPVGN